ncbi:ABC transporter ATP-binding protein [Azospirillum thermophilum]|uniref:ABC transporter ATP-binding protein n=1 Tax=Azospirillum thermophilum TaxID=2202148 RepID=A0A2S2CKU0_9PROT|nr:ABC transporter ATP-binding protein [Azospirillum thermophilum]AWK84990.1 ABC transporter ATP-binding protein [Azospirillum thermophilum]
MTHFSPIPPTAAPAAASARPAVEFRSVCKRYGSFTAVGGVSFAIETGTLVTLLGPSGCGKTTTLRMIAGLEQASSGSILIGGEDVTGRSAAERDVSMVFQSYALFPHMSILDNVAYGLVVGGMPKRQAAEAARAKLELVGLAGLEKRLPSELSGGQQQRVAVARAIVLEPRVLLFDEPLSNLDAKMRRRVREDIRQLQQSLKLTVVYVTHDQEEALAVSDRIIVMSGGEIAQDGSPRDLYERPASRFIADFIGDANIVPAVLDGRDGEIGRFRVGTAALALPHRGVSGGIVDLAVRPNAIRLSGGTSSEGVPGCIRYAAYLGDHMEYEVAVTLGGKEMMLFAAIPDVEAPFAVGDAVTVGFAPQGVTAIPA